MTEHKRGGKEKSWISEKKKKKGNPSTAAADADEDPGPDGSRGRNGTQVPSAVSVLGLRLLKCDFHPPAPIYRC